MYIIERNQTKCCYFFPYLLLANNSQIVGVLELALCLVIFFFHKVEGSQWSTFFSIEPTNIKSQSSSSQSLKVVGVGHYITLSSSWNIMVINRAEHKFWVFGPKPPDSSGLDMDPIAYGFKFEWYFFGLGTWWVPGVIGYESWCPMKMGLR